MTAPHAARLPFFPIAWFAMVMGVAGLAIAWEKAERLMGLAIPVSQALLGLGTLLFIVLAGLYGLKALKYRDAVAREWAHPVMLNFAPTLSIALMLLAVAWLPHSAPYSKLQWLIGAALHLVLTLHVMTRWMRRGGFDITQLNPAWFMPVVGNLVAPIAGVSHAPPEVSWFFFSIGLVFWPVLLALVMYRLVFFEALPERLMPTLFILIAPPAAGLIAYVGLSGALDTLAMLLFNVGLFFTLLLFAQLGGFVRLRFNLSWWAYSFPLAAISTAGFVLYEHSGNLLYARLASLLLGLASVVIGGLLARTALAVLRREICMQN